MSMISSQERKTEFYYWLLIISALLFALLASTHNLDTERKKGQYYWQTHQEGTSQARTRDDQLRPVDGFSREFPIVYNFLGDSVLGYIANIRGEPPYVTQSYFYPKLLAALFLIGNFVSIYVITRSKLASLFSALLLLYISDLAFSDSLYKVIDANLYEFKNRMHLPSIALQLGVGQSAGWVLFLPVIASAYLARKRSALTLYVLTGLGLGVLIQVHTLTFINVMSIVSVWFMVSSCKEGMPLRWARQGLFVAIFGAVAYFSREFGLVQLATMWMGALLLSIRCKKDLLQISVMGLSALVVSSQFILSLIDSLSLNGGFSIHVDSSLDYKLVLGYFGLFWCLFILVLMGRRSEPEKLGMTIVGVTLIFSFGQLFGFYNHQYRFVINLCFGLFFLAPLAIMKLDRYDFWRIPLEGVWRPGKEKIVSASLVLLLGLGLTGMLCISAYGDVMIQTGHPDKVTALGYNAKYYNINYATQRESEFLHAISEIPNKSRVLLPPEDMYPRRVFHNAIMLGTGDLRAFIPDYRYIVDKASYKSRVLVYCAIFDKYQHIDVHYGDKFCADFNVGTKKVDPVGALDVLGIYGIDYIIQWPESGDENLASLYDATNIYKDKDGYKIWKRDCKDALDAGRACFSNANVNDDIITFTAKIPREGAYQFCFSGENLAAEILEIRVGQQKVQFTVDETDTVSVDYLFNTLAPESFSFQFREGKVKNQVPLARLYYAKGVWAGKNGKCGQ